jgi:hypothetical protein
MAPTRRLFGPDEEEEEGHSARTTAKQGVQRETRRRRRADVGAGRSPQGQRSSRQSVGTRHQREHCESGAAREGRSGRLGPAARDGPREHWPLRRVPVVGPVSRTAGTGRSSVIGLIRSLYPRPRQRPGRSPRGTVMTRPVHVMWPARGSEVVPTIAPAPHRAEMAVAATVGFTSLLTSFPQLRATRSVRCDRMKNLTAPGPLHWPTHPPRSPGHAVIGGPMVRSRTD